MTHPKHPINTPYDAATWIWEVQRPKLRTALQPYVEQVMNHDRFMTWPASCDKHHAYEGGLLVHTAQVCYTALQMLHGLEPVRRELTLVAGLWHDYGKIWDYQPADVGLDPRTRGWWENTEHRQLIRHLPRSYSEFVHAARTLGGLTQEEEDFVGHLILSHHGRLEWQSPVTPQCAEAWALHAADMLSAWYTNSAKES